MREVTHFRNRPSLSPTSAAMVVLTTFAVFLFALFTPTTSECQTPPNDAEITQAVTAEISHDPAVEAEAVGVTTADGVVTLKGTVESLLLKNRAERIAETAKGVRSVVNLLEVEPAQGRSDREIRRDVEAALLTDPAADSYEILTEVSDGIVTLTGTVDSFAEKLLAESVAESVRGVRGIVDEIALNPEPVRRDEEIQGDVEGMLRWDVLVDDALIDATVDAGRVVLRGVVGSAAEKRRATEDAWVSGVRDVDASRLTVARWARDQELRGDKYEDVTDEEIEAAVKRGLFYDPRVLEATVFADSRNGVVTLSGTVDNLRARRAAEDVARSTVGVRDVDNQITVDPEAPPSDAEIGLKIEEAVERDPLLSSDSVEAAVDAGKVTLIGTVGTPFERARADHLASQVSGVRAVQNLLDVEEWGDPLLHDPFIEDYDPSGFPWYHYRPGSPGASDEAVEEAVEQELLWSPFVDSRTIMVTVEDGVATLTGTVGSARERRRATLNAYEGGAVHVQNDLEIRR